MPCFPGDRVLACLGGVGPSDWKLVDPESSRASSSMSSMSPADSDMSWSPSSSRLFSEMDGMAFLLSWISLWKKSKIAQLRWGGNQEVSYF